jgi:hypothetical protein
MVAEYDRAGGPTGLTHACAKLRQFRIGVDDVTLDGLTCRLIVAAVIDSYPEALKIT